MQAEQSSVGKVLFSLLILPPMVGSFSTMSHLAAGLAISSADCGAGYTAAGGARFVTELLPPEIRGAFRPTWQKTAARAGALWPFGGLLFVFMYPGALLTDIAISTEGVEPRPLRRFAEGGLMHSGRAGAYHYAGKLMLCDSAAYMA